jgi:hypothetical protein
MARTLVLAALVSGAALLGCKGSGPQMDLPMYPGSSGAGGLSNQESATGTMFRARRKTPDGVTTVAAFYRKELADARGWRDASSLGPAFTDGNLTVEQAGLATARGTLADPARGGGFVVVYELDGATYFDAWQWVPAATR